MRDHEVFSIYELHKSPDRGEQTFPDVIPVMSVSGKKDGITRCSHYLGNFVASSRTTLNPSLARTIEA